MWIVYLTKTPKQNDFRDDFFPRRVHYKSDAKILVKEVEAKGGKAEIAKDDGDAIGEMMGRNK